MRTGGRGYRHRGFTLIEVVVTLAIVAIAAVVAVPALLSEREPSELEAATQRLESILRLARDSAISGAVPVRVVIDSASAFAWLAADPGDGRLSDPPGAPGTVSLGTSPSIRMLSSGARSEFLFQPNGSAFPDSILLSDATGSRLVTLDPLTGHVLVLR